MSFLTPLFLVGLAGLAIPVLIHLIQKERKNVVQFPSLMFLRRIPYESVQRRRIRHWLLLMMRLAALALVVLAFARPFIRRTDAATGGATGAREVVILVDRSYSMGYGDRWQRAVTAARNAVNGLGASDRASIVFFSAGADVAVRSTADKGRLLAALAGVEPSAGATHYGPALKLAGSILSESALPRKETVLVTDFQRAGWQGAEGLRLPDGATLTPVDLGSGDTVNAAVTPVALERSMFSNQERVSVTAGVLNHGAKPLDGVDVALEVDGRAIQTKRVRVEGNGSASTTFDPLTVATPNMRASIRIVRDALERDNVFHFVLSPARPIRVLLAQRPGARDVNLYLSRALAVGDAPRFDLVPRDPDALSSDDLQNAGIVDPQRRGGHGGARQSGSRGSCSVAGACSFVAGQRGAWPQEQAALAARGCQRSRRSVARDQPARLVALEYGHAIFDPFRAPRSGDFSTARFYGYRASNQSPGRCRACAIRRWGPGAGGEARWAPAGCWCGCPRWIWCGTTLPSSPCSSPSCTRWRGTSARYREAAPWLTVGDVLDPSTAENYGEALGPTARSCRRPASAWRSTAKGRTSSNWPNRASTKFADWQPAPCRRRLSPRTSTCGNRT